MIFAPLFGFLASVVPNIFEFFKSKMDNKQELAILDRQVEMQKAGFNQRLEEINTQADIAESAALNDRIKPIGIRWVDAMASSIRPILTYLFFLDYVIVKIAFGYAYYHAQPLPWLDNRHWFDIIIKLWDEDDRAIFGAVMGFWFGSRAMRNNK